MMYGAIILAAGDGKRMQSKLPKVLHNFAGEPILIRIIKEVLKVSVIQQIVIVAGIHLEQLKLTCHDHGLYKNNKIVWVNQGSPLGTADAVITGLQHCNAKIDNILILSGDLPLISAASLRLLIDNSREINSNNNLMKIGLLTSNVEQPHGLGRIIRDEKNNFLKIVEEVEASHLEKKIKEINVGVYLFPRDFLNINLPKLTNINQQQEYYLTEIFNFINYPYNATNINRNNNKLEVYSINPIDYLESFSVNNRKELIDLERKYNIQQANKLLEQGITILDPNRLDIRGEVDIALDVEIDINVVLIGKVIIKTQAKIGANCYIKNSTIGQGAIIEPNSVIEDAVIENNVKIGPFARVRPGAHIKSYAKIGNFVEIKNSNIGMCSKINHLSYIGDSNIGNNVNIGAGVITCNYDGVNKHKTIIEDDVSIGAACQLIAPVVVQKAATIAAGTTLLKDAPAHQLTLNKKIQSSIEWQKPTKNVDYNGSKK